MAFESVIDLDTDTTFALGGRDKKTNKANPTNIQGYYLGSKTVASPKSKTGTAQLHVFQTAKGNVGIWGKTDMDRKMLSATPGAMTRVSFTGMIETKNNPMYKYKVEIDKANVIDVSGLGDAGNVASNEAADPGYDDGPSYGEPGDYTSDDSGVDGEDAPPADEPPPARASAPRTPAKAPDAAQRARVNQLLTGRK